MQYTIRNVPNFLDAVLRRRAQEQGKSLNEVALEALTRGVGFATVRLALDTNRYTDLCCGSASVVG